jgi:tRNA pseudouridine38-40 synthase
MRYFIHLAYNGAKYSGWQRQPKCRSVQETLETAFSTILSVPVEIVGCGRTDAGVHARTYFAHFDFDGIFPEAFLRRMNKFLPADIVLYDMIPVAAEAHARFDAYHRAYEYHICLRKDPFRQHTTWFYPFGDRLSLEQMEAAASLLLNYSHFYTFCKSGSDAKTMACQLYNSHWVKDGDQLVFHIAANRFLRGMVRLIVGMCLSVGSGQISLREVREALDKQQWLSKSVSVPPDGLFLTEVRYPTDLFSAIP